MMSDKKGVPERETILKDNKNCRWMIANCHALQIHIVPHLLGTQKTTDATLSSKMTHVRTLHVTGEQPIR